MAEQETLVTLMQAHQRGVWRYLRLLGADEALADDLTQDTFIAVLRKPFEQRGGDATAAYLRTVARNLYLKTLRRDALASAARDADEADAIWASDDGEDNAQPYLDALRACLETLEEHMRQALAMRYRDNASREAIAQALDMPENSARNLMQRAKERLRDCITRRLKDGE